LYHCMPKHIDNIAVGGHDHLLTSREPGDWCSIPKDHVM
jgi:hypothetical protein